MVTTNGYHRQLQGQTQGGRRHLRKSTLPLSHLRSAIVPRERVVRSFLFVESSVVGLLRFYFRTDKGYCTMPEVREDDDFVPIPLKNVAPAIPKWEPEMRELIEDLTQMGCEGLLAKP